MPIVTGVLRGSGPAPEGYVGPCDCDGEGSHFHRYEPQAVEPMARPFVAGASLSPMGLRPVLSCGCEDHPTGSVFYTSARNATGAHAPISGPYKTHDKALAALDGDKRWVADEMRDPRAPWYAYGTMSAPEGHAIRTARSQA